MLGSGAKETDTQQQTDDLSRSNSKQKQQQQAEAALRQQLLQRPASQARLLKAWPLRSPPAELIFSMARGSAAGRQPEWQEVKLPPGVCKALQRVSFTCTAVGAVLYVMGGNRRDGGSQELALKP